MSDGSRPSLRSRIVQAMHFIDNQTGSIVPPLHTSTTFARDENYNTIGSFTYGRYGNPTVNLLEDILCELDGGAGALCFSSGLAAFSVLFEAVPAGARIVLPRVMYHGGLDWLLALSKKRAINLEFYQPGDMQSLQRAATGGNTYLVWVETPANPSWQITDIAAAAKIAHEAGAILGVDSTCAPPVTTTALALGADIVFHSASKYLNGHSDVTAGVLVCAHDNKLWQEIRATRKSLGSILGNFEAWLVLRGLRTLFIRFETASANAMKIARHFENHTRIEQVLYPGLETHPGHDVAKRQMKNGFGGMMSLLIKGDETRARQITASLKLFIPATSLGGVESLAEHRKSVEGPNSVVAGNLIRLSVGIEDADELIADLEQALASEN